MKNTLNKGIYFVFYIYFLFLLIHLKTETVSVPFPFIKATMWSQFTLLLRVGNSQSLESRRGINWCHHSPAPWEPFGQETSHRGYTCWLMAPLGSGIPPDTFITSFHQTWHVFYFSSFFFFIFLSSLNRSNMLAAVCRCLRTRPDMYTQLSDRMWGCLFTPTPLSLCRWVI